MCNFTLLCVPRPERVAAKIFGWWEQWSLWFVPSLGNQYPVTHWACHMVPVLTLVRATYPHQDEWLYPLFRLQESDHRNWTSMNCPGVLETVSPSTVLQSLLGVKWHSFYNKFCCQDRRDTTRMASLCLGMLRSELGNCRWSEQLGMKNLHVLHANLESKGTGTVNKAIYTWATCGWGFLQHVVSF